MPVVPETSPPCSDNTFPSTGDPASKVNTSAPYDYTKPASQKDVYHAIGIELIRYSEVLLWYAEAKAKMGQTGGRVGIQVSE